MAKIRPDSVEGLYSLGRTYPGGRRPHDIAPKVKARTYEQPDPAQQRPQSREDQHAPGYDNDAKGWVRGMGKQSPHPHFDYSAPRDKLRSCPLCS